ncbi:cardiolipin synthase [Gorillibacterium sp. CAU 1737]|uniref:cardiolipin synthase n=1 Tax=Gorillibacterium sp. CAU 1737 TaxID=3140362 RepID=UPI003261D04A
MTFVSILLVLIALIWAQVGVILLLEARYPARCAAWVLVQLPLPVLGLLVYAGFGRRMPSTSEARKPRIPDPIPEHANPDQLERLLTLAPSYPIQEEQEPVLINRVDETFERILADMAKARRTIDFLLYIYRDDEIGTIFTEQLEKKAREGLQVRLLLDGSGSRELPAAFLTRLKEAGVQVAKHNPLVRALFKGKLNFRNHRKLFLIDEQIGYVGGLNVGDEYLGGNAHLGYWRDSTIRLEGEPLLFLTRLFQQDWVRAHGQESPEAVRELVSPVDDEGVGSAHDEEGSGRIFLLAGSPEFTLSPLYQLFLASLASARKRIYIASPYFVPDEAVWTALATAAAAGVEVRVLLPEIADYKIIHYAGLSYAAELAAQGVQFHLYQKGFLHQKTLLIDDRLAGIGTFNLDQQSFYQNYDLHVFLTGKQAVARMEQAFEKDLMECRDFDLAAYLSDRPLGKRLLETGCRLLGPLL